MSLRLRLLLAAGIVALIALVLADLATYAALGSYLNTEVDNSLNRAHAGIEACLDAGASPTPALLEGNDPGAFLEEMTPGGRVTGRVPAFRFEDGSGSELIGPALPSALTALHPHRSASGPAAPAGRDCESPNTVDTPQPPTGSPPSSTSTGTPPVDEQVTYFTAGPAKAGGPGYRVRASTLTNGNIMILATPLTETSRTLDRLLLIELGVTGVALALAVALGWWLVRVGVRPLVQIEQSAEAIGDGELGARIAEPRRSTTEIGRLARVLNSMLGRIEQAFVARDLTEQQLTRSEERMRQFLADASHELRTPLAAVSAYAELFDRSLAEHPEDLPRILNGIRVESSRMGQLIGDLLLLANLDEGRPLEHRPVELVSVASRAVDAAHAVGPEWPVRLLAEQPVEIDGDAARIRQVFDNLLANVRSHTARGTRTDVVISTVGDSAEIRVADHGLGLDEEAVRHAFDRFYRADSSRTRARGGSGLGLAIVRAIVLAHEGSVLASETAGGGATFTVRLPFGPPPERPAGPRPGDDPPRSIAPG